MKGTVIKRGRSWSVVIDAGRDLNGKRIRKWHSGYQTKRDAERARVEILGRMQAGTYVEPSRLRVSGFLLEQWLPAKQPTLKANTFVTATVYVESYIVPALGSRLLQELTPALVNDFYSTLLLSGGRQATGLRPKTVRNIHGVLHKALADAERWGLVRRNVAALADPPSGKSSVMKSWDAAQLRTFLTAVEGDRLHALWVLGASTGMRRSELLGLAWRNVDLGAQRLAVADTLVMVGRKPVLRESEAKSAAAHRTVALDSATVETLREHRRRQLEERMAAGPIWKDTGLVFTREDGSIVNPEWLTRAFKRHVSTAGLPWIGLHGLRHTHATMALKAGVPAKVVQERLGHSSVTITLDTYSHVLPNMQRDAAERIAELMFGP
jgi:integrase